MVHVLAWSIGFVVLVATVALSLLLRRRHMDRWLGSYLRQANHRGRRPIPPDQEMHVLLAIADHFEPHNGRASDNVAADRVTQWLERYPRLLGAFRDSDGRPPRHTFFYPMEQYEWSEVEPIARLCRQGFGELEIHLHHDRDTSENLRRELIRFKGILDSQHQLLSRDRLTGELKYGFVHGNWALDNCHPDGRHCGVNDELDVLRETGCYADFTLPSAPSPTQTRKINSIYYAVDDPQRPKSHDTGVDLCRGPAPAKGLMLIQGPLLLDWRRRRRGLMPRIENSCIQGNQPPTMARLDLWVRASVQVASRPDWFFVKLHTHGALEANQAVLLGDAMVRFHEALAQRARTNPAFHFHYVTAREMYNLARAAEAGWQGGVAGARDFELLWNGASAPAAVPAAADPSAHVEPPAVVAVV